MITSTHIDENRFHSIHKLLQTLELGHVKFNLKLNVSCPSVQFLYFRRWNIRLRAVNDLLIALQHDRDILHYGNAVCMHLKREKRKVILLGKFQYDLLGAFSRLQRPDKITNADGERYRIAILALNLIVFKQPFLRKVRNSI
jgi:hypothetical protein